jgi:predicted transcriptional regulator
MYYELSKSQKKIARRIMDKGLEKHYQRSLFKAEEILNEWKNDKFATTREAYMRFYREVEKNDDLIANIYNNKGGSRWVEIMSLQLRDGVITTDDLQELDNEVREIIIKLGHF